MYEIVSARLLRLHGSAELTLYGDGCDAVSEHLIRAALRVRCLLYTSPLMKKQILTEAEYRDMREKYDEDFRAGMGAESIKELLAELDLDQLSKELTAELREASGQKRLRIIKRLEVVESFRLSHNRPE